MNTPDVKPEKMQESGGQTLRFRTRLLNIVAVIVALAAIPVAIPNALAAYRLGNKGLAAIFIFATLLAIANAIVRRFPYSYQIRTWVILGILYVVGFIAYTHSGLYGDARVWILTAVALAAMLLPPQQILINAALALGMHFGLGYALTHKLLAYKSTIGVPPMPYNIWVREGLTLAAVTATIDGGIWFLLRSIGNALEESHALSNALEYERLRLEQQSALLKKRLDQINTAAEINRALNTILDPNKLIQTVVDLVQKRFHLYYAGVFLLDERGEYAVLRAGTGEAGRKMLAEGHRLAVGGSSMIGWAISNRKPRIAMDVGEDAVRFANPHLPLTRTELALPLISRGEVLGAMTIQSDKPRAFDENDLKVLQSIADNLATALHNAYLFQQTQQALEEIVAARRQIMGDIWANLPSTLEASVSTSPSTNGTSNKYRLRVPIEIYNEEIGELVLEKDEPWASDEEEMARQAAAQIALALENLQLVEETRRTAEMERVVSQISGEVSATLDMDEMLKTALKQLQNVLGLTQAEIVLTAGETE